MTGPAREGSAAGKERPLYEIVRDQLIDEIKTGKYPAGALLPSVREITVQWTVSTTTARKVLAELVAAGYARSEGTRGHVSAGSMPAPPEATPSPQAGLSIRTPQMVSMDGGLQATTSAVDVRPEPAPAEVALTLDLSEPRASVVVRRTLAVDAHGAPIELRTSYTIREVADGTPLAESETIESPWREALAEHSGRGVTLVQSHIMARHPSDSEAAMLALAPTACVLVRRDFFHDGQGRPIDHTVTVWPGDTTLITTLAPASS